MKVEDMGISQKMLDEANILQIFPKAICCFGGAFCFPVNAN